MYLTLNALRYTIFMEKSKNYNQNLTVPNALSVLRILIIPFFSYYFLCDKLDVAIVLICISGLSDAVDGFIARKFNQVTELGKLLDPFADKLTQITILVCLAVRIPRLSPFLVILFFKEIAMLVMASKLIIKNCKKPCAARWYGKVGTILFYISASIIVLMNYVHVDLELFKIVSPSLLCLTTIAMIYSGIKYFQVYRNIIKSTESKHNFNLEEELKRKK